MLRNVTVSTADLAVELVGDGHDDRFHLRVGQHGVIVGISDLGLVDGGHALAQVGGAVADGV